ncbi:hypothetical protein V8G54_004008, partial [Vigna mungo]
QLVQSPSSLSPLTSIVIPNKTPQQHITIAFAICTRTRNTHKAILSPNRAIFSQPPIPCSAPITHSIILQYHGHLQNHPFLRLLITPLFLASLHKDKKNPTEIKNQQTSIF